MMQVNGMLLEGKKVFVGPFLKRTDRPADKEAHYTNIYVKNLAESVTEEQLDKMFGEFGKVCCCGQPAWLFYVRSVCCTSLFSSCCPDANAHCAGTCMILACLCSFSVEAWPLHLSYACSIGLGCSIAGHGTAC